jgi:hypothetical protein
MNVPLRNLEDQEATHHSKTKELACFLLLGVVTVIVFSQLFNKENSLSYSIGYNLYGAERVLDGEIPYRDFHTLYPPATVYLNAAIFRYFGITLFQALCAVLIFKILTTAMLYLCARRLMPCHWSFCAAVFSLFWLRPNGPFKAVPMHYGALFLAVALFFLLSRKASNLDLLFAGLGLGLLALFKHNIGAYALAGAVVVALLDDQASPFAVRTLLKNYRRALMLLLGCALPVLPVLIYMQSKGALQQMIQTLLFGPGEFLLNRLAAAPLPIVPIFFALWLTICLLAAKRCKTNNAMVLLVLTIAILSVSGFLLFAKQEFVDALIFYAPVAVILAGFYFSLFARKYAVDKRRALLSVTVAAAAAFMETFPRFAREQAIASMPFVALLLLAILYGMRQHLEAFAPARSPFKLALAIFPLIIFLMGARLFFQTFFTAQLRFKSDTALACERGRGVFFPAEKAYEINQTVAYLQERVPEGGYFFPQSYAGSSYLFLADRNNPSGAQFWGGVGVKDTERAATLFALERENVRLMVTSNRDLAAEKYQPMRDFINQNFTQTREFGETLILER